MTTTLVNVRMDKTTKKEMSELCDQLGMSMSTAFNMFAKAMVRERRIPFEITADPFWSATNIHRLEQASARMDAGLGQPHELIED